MDILEFWNGFAMVCRCGLGEIGASGLSSGCDREATSRAKGSTLWSGICPDLRQQCPWKISPELYHGSTRQVEDRESLSRSWFYELLSRERQQREDLYKWLPCQCRKRLPLDASISEVPNRIDVDQRPPAVDDRNALGH